jgi:ribosomal protein S18 acetylase RimI-like enzyme
MTSSYQQQGIGRIAVKLACEDPASRSFKAARVAHSPESTSASKFYESIGFRSCGADNDGDPYLETPITPNKAVQADDFGAADSSR